MVLQDKIRSKEKVSGKITIEWEWATRTDQLKIEKWIPLLKELTYGDERALSFLSQEDLLPHMSVSVARYILGRIESGEVHFPTEKSRSFTARHAENRKTQIFTNVADWEKDFADEDELSEGEEELKESSS